jgi:tetratricopeptide (TPR) repeat protein
MDSYTLTLFEKTATDLELRCFAGTDLLSQNPIPPDELTDFIHRTEKEYAAPLLSLDRLGRDLYDWLERVTGGGVSEMRKRSRAVCLHIESGDGLRHLPWELLHDGDGFLCVQSRRPFTPARRVTDFALENTDPQNRPLRVLFMASSPEGVEPVLQFETEEARILEQTRNQGLELLVEESGSLEGLARVIADYPDGHFDVIHLTGHADIRDDRPGFWLEDDMGAPVFADADGIADALGGRFPRLLFLSGCRTGESAGGGALRSLSESLVDAGAPAVLGWALPVGDVAATQAAAELYGWLADGKDLDAAAVHARRKLHEAESPYWHLLRLYADATPLTAHVTPRNTPGREKRKTREAAQHFLDAGGRKIPVCARADFVGRRRLLQRALRTLRANVDAPEGAAGLALLGMGGLGKSSLAARLCDRMAHTHDPWVWYGGVDETDLRRVIGEKLLDDEARKVLNDPNPNFSFLDRLRIVLENHLERPVLFVLDDFEHNAEAAARSGNAGPKDGRFAPRTRDDGTMILKPEAREAVDALIRAIRETGSDSRVVITCRYGVDLDLKPLNLDSFQGADLRKKTDALPGFAADGPVSPELRERARKLAAGNPRLLEWLDTVLRDSDTDSESILNRLENEAEKFREDVLLEALLEQLRTPVLRILALLAVYRLPVPVEAVRALTDDPDLPGHLKRLTNLGLAERIAAGKGAGEFFASPLVGELLEGELTEAEVTEAQRAGARALKALWWDGGGETEERGLEIRRLALAGEEAEIAAGVTDWLAWRAINRNRYREAQDWCLELLELVEDWRILFALGRAEFVLGEPKTAMRYERALERAPEISDNTTKEVLHDYSALLHNLADLREQNGDVERALDLWNQSLKLLENIGDVKGKAATLHNMAGVFAQQGEVQKALDLWNQSLKLKENIGDVKGKAATLVWIATVFAQQGEVQKALDLWNQSLKLYENIGDVKGKAATLHEMAGVFAQQGEVQKAMELYSESAEIEEKIGNLGGKAATLHQMAGVFAQQGEVQKALDLWNQSLKLYDNIGDVKGKAATLHQMASVFAQQGEVRKAMELYSESAEIQEKIGNLRGKAATLAQMAYAAYLQKDLEQARELYRQALAALAQIGAWLDVVTVIANLSAISDETESRACLAQALWITLRAGVPLTSALAICQHLIQKTGGPQADPAPLLAGGMIFFINTRGQNHPQREEIANQITGFAAACAQARNIPDDQIQQWLETEGILDPNRLLPALNNLLESWVTEWYFDRSAFAGKG